MHVNDSRKYSSFSAEFFSVKERNSNENFFKVSQRQFLCFKKKWRASHSDFVKYFHDQWLLKNEQWFEKAAVGQPSNNNDSEYTNGVIKTEYTMRDRLVLVGQVLTCVLQIVSDWSETQNPESANCIEYATTPKVSLPVWTAACQ